MKVLIQNTHKYYEFSKGELNKSLAERAKAFFEKQGHEVRLKH
jgi:modulator of drug activity B